MPLGSDRRGQLCHTLHERIAIGKHGIIQPRQLTLDQQVRKSRRQGLLQQRPDMLFVVLCIDFRQPLQGCQQAHRFLADHGFGIAVLRCCSFCLVVIWPIGTLSQYIQQQHAALPGIQCILVCCPGAGQSSRAGRRCQMTEKLAKRIESLMVSHLISKLLLTV